MLERDLQDLVVDLCAAQGLLCYHTYDSRRSVPGFPDLCIVGHNGVLWRELKTATGTVSPEQRHWLLSLREAGEDAAVWRPRHWPDAITREVMALGRLHTTMPPMTPAQVRREMARRGAKKGPRDGTIRPSRG